MKTGRFLKMLFLVLVVVFLISGTVFVSRVTAGGCTVSDIQGDWICYFDGLIIDLQAPVAAVGVFTTDKEGTMKGERTINIGGQVIKETLACDLVVGLDCSISADCVSGSGYNESFDAAIGNNKKEVRFVSVPAPPPTLISVIKGACIEQ